MDLGHMTVPLHDLTMISSGGPMDKGKAKANENVDPDLELANLNPTITYRHLLSQVPHVK
jgi:hypothetical protein